MPTVFGIFAIACQHLPLDSNNCHRASLRSTIQASTCINDLGLACELYRTRSRTVQPEAGSIFATSSTLFIESCKHSFPYLDPQSATIVCHGLKCGCWEKIHRGGSRVGLLGDLFECGTAAGGQEAPRRRGFTKAPEAQLTSLKPFRLIVNCLLVADKAYIYPKASF